MKTKDIIFVSLLIILFAIGITLAFPSPITYTFTLADGTQIVSEVATPLVVNGIIHHWVTRTITLQFTIGLLFLGVTCGAALGYVLKELVK